MIGSIGILQNNANIFDAVFHGTNNASVITGPQYMNGHALQSSTPDVPIFDTKTIPAGVFSGTYSIGFFYDSNSATENGTQLLRYQIFEDDELMSEDQSTYLYGTVYQFDLNYLEHIHKYGLYANFKLDADKNHRLVIKTSPELEHDAILDYVIFEKVAGNSIVNGNPIAPRMGKRDISASGYNYLGGPDNLEDYGTQLVYEQITGTLTGNLSAGVTTEHGWTYNTPFKTVIGAYPQVIDANAQLLINWSGVNIYDQVLVKIKNISSSTWSKAVTDTSRWDYFNMRIFVVGYI